MGFTWNLRLPADDGFINAIREILEMRQLAGRSAADAIAERCRG
jgi:hypothetical protein